MRFNQLSNVASGLSIVLLSGLSVISTHAMADVNSLLNTYAQQGATQPDAQKGRELWNTPFAGDVPFTTRSCNSCHTKDLTQAGKHIKTSKAIKPMSPSVNAERLTDNRKVEKWFLRNCKWTLGRECSVSEKADLLLYINTSEKF